MLTIADWLLAGEPVSMHDLLDLCLHTMQWCPVSLAPNRHLESACCQLHILAGPAFLMQSNLHFWLTLVVKSALPKYFSKCRAESILQTDCNSSCCFLNRDKISNLDTARYSMLPSSPSFLQAHISKLPVLCQPRVHAPHQVYVHVILDP